MQPGYIKLYRQLLENPLWLEKPFSRGQAWVDLLLMANFTDGKLLQGGQVIPVPRGCFITSEAYLMNRWGWGKSRLRTFFRLLEQEDMIDRQADRNRTTLRLKKYWVYQDARPPGPSGTDRRQTTGEAPADRIIQEGNKNRTKYIPPYIPPETGGTSSGESLTVAKMAGGAAEAADLSRTRTDHGFARFWEAYPRKADRQKARRAWERLQVDDRLLDTILAALRLQKASEQWTREGGKYIPYPSNWLSGRRWEDTPSPPAGKSGKDSYAGYDINLVQQMLDMQNEG